MPTVVIDPAKCKGHEVCMQNCPVSVFEKQGDRIVVAHQDQCTACRVCEQGCPEGAITVTED